MSYLRMYTRAITVHLYWFFFVILISFLPILVQIYAPLQPYLLGLYHDLGAWDLFFVSMFGSIAVWSLMITRRFHKL